MPRSTGSSQPLLPLRRAAESSAKGAKPIETLAATISVAMRIPVLSLLVSSRETSHPWRHGRQHARQRRRGVLFHVVATVPAPLDASILLGHLAEVAPHAYVLRDLGGRLRRSCCGRVSEQARLPLLGAKRDRPPRGLSVLLLRQSLLLLLVELVRRVLQVVDRGLQEAGSLEHTWAGPGRAERHRASRGGGPVRMPETVSVLGVPGRGRALHALRHLHQLLSEHVAMALLREGCLADVEARRQRDALRLARDASAEAEKSPEGASRGGGRVRVAVATAVRLGAGGARSVRAAAVAVASGDLRVAAPATALVLRALSAGAGGWL
mmetsp:Transcript_34333/g.102002  ORF Transcript_34333/g.102002 Transcript_34333/m.102002 type:complete len:324 (+) Transcript_34333:409-1380(+)